MNTVPLRLPSSVRPGERSDVGHYPNVRLASSGQREMSSLRRALDKLGAMPGLSARAACHSGRGKHERQY